MNFSIEVAKAFYPMRQKIFKFTRFQYNVKLKSINEVYEDIDIIIGS